MSKFTKQEKQAYFKELREQWKAAKLQAEKKGNEIDAIIRNHGLNISRTGFMMIRLQMEAQGLDGLPYLDAKTYQGWKENGFQVKKGESSTLSGITWISANSKNEPDRDPIDDDQSDFRFPKQYHLFHRSQVEAIQVEAA
jgi:hypothetical protein